MLFSNGQDLFDNTYQRYLIKFLRDHSPFREVPIKLQLRAKKRSEPPQDRPGLEEAPAAPPEPEIDISNLQFRSEVTDEEFDRASKRKDRGLWEI